MICEITRLQKRQWNLHTEEEVLSTVKVMGGEDWADWIDALKAADVLTENAVTVAYSYIGPELTYPIYYHGTIGTAKQHLQKTMTEINQAHPDVRAVISVNKGLVTQASAAIPGCTACISLSSIK